VSVRPGVPDAFLALSALNERKTRLCLSALTFPLPKHLFNSDLTCDRCALKLISFDSNYSVKRQ
jgi:hypothetical protein